MDLSTNWKDKDKGGRSSVVGSLTETSQKVLHVGVVQTCAWPANSEELHGKPENLSAGVHTRHDAAWMVLCKVGGQCTTAKTEEKEMSRMC